MDFLVLLTFAIALTTGIVSGLSGGGAGFITTPYFIFIGLSPHQAIATGKMGGLGVSFGSIAAFKGKGLVQKKYLIHFLAITTVCALAAAWLLPKIDGLLLQKIIGVALVVLAPTLFINKASLQPGERTGAWITVGFILYTLVSFGQTMVSAGVGTLLVLVMMFMFGMTALEANATKRVAQLSQAVILFVLLLAQGLIVLSHGIAALIGSAVGGHIGSKIAVNKGNKFVKWVLAGTMLLSGISLLIW